MVSQRYRSQQTIGGKLLNLQQKTDEAASAQSTPSENSVDAKALATNSVTSDALAPNSVDSEALGNGAVGTENLGVVDQINSGNKLTLNSPGGVQLTGGGYTNPTAPDTYPVALGSDGSMVVAPVAFPPGIITAFAGTSSPTGWLICDGSAVSRTTYAALFSLISTIYGAGDGSTTFNLPNFKGRMLVGQDTSQTEFSVFGGAGGTKTETLTSAQIPSHTHGVSDPGHSHRQVVTNPTAGGTAIRNDYNSDGAGGIYDQGVNTNSSGTGISITATGGGGSHNNLPPYRVINYIIKAF